MNIRLMTLLLAALGLTLLPLAPAATEDAHHRQDNAGSGAPPALAPQPGMMPMMDMMGQGGMPMMNMMGNQGGEISSTQMMQQHQMITQRMDMMQQMMQHMMNQQSMMMDERHMMK